MSMYWLYLSDFALLSWLVSSRLQNKFEKYSKIPMRMYVRKGCGENDVA